MGVKEKITSEIEYYLVVYQRENERGEEGSSTLRSYYSGRLDGLNSTLSYIETEEEGDSDL